MFSEVLLHLHGPQSTDPCLFPCVCAHLVSCADFQRLMYVKWYRAMAQPGEAVGVIAGQSIGEPSTQASRWGLGFEQHMAFGLKGLSGLRDLG